MGDKADNENSFVKKCNFIFEHAKFNSQRQRKGESIDNFITDLHCLERPAVMVNYIVK